MIQLTLIKQPSMKERKIAAKKRRKEHDRGEDVLDFFYYFYEEASSSLRSFSVFLPLCFGSSPCFYCVVWRDCLSVQLQGHRHASIPHTHAHNDAVSKVLSADMALKMCERFRLHGERGHRSKRVSCLCQCLVRTTRVEPPL